ncbi:hypothetical protein [Salibacterium qingdaonense]|uniref:Uncharacterized protein n=1 Tax=Salibacterium qingdaonense TaxID=266892 RepID=A0A1I4KQP9_9BACI|nr:hypothetical protein [Salibacterium qingdaonense]SFL80926.1 hypothetical protein SAMN04488054_105160 [Salibacterium qingdaonense]
MFSKIKWNLKQLLPFKYHTVHRTMSGQKKVTIWRMWMGRVFNSEQYTVK